MVLKKTVLQHCPHNKYPEKKLSSICPQICHGSENCPVNICIKKNCLIRDCPQGKMSV